MRLNKLTGLVLLCLAFFSSGLVAQENKFSLSSYGGELSSDPNKFLYFNNLDGVLFLTGSIEKGMYTIFRQAITENKIHTIVLNSSGGDVEEGLNIAGTIFDKEIKTYIPEGYKCYSACSFIFFAGAEKYALGELGVHQAAYADDISKEKAAIGAIDLLSQLSTADILLRLGEFNTPRFVEQRMLRTAPGDMYVFNETELNKLGNLDVSNNNKVLFKDIDKFIADFQKYYAEQDCDNDVKKCSSNQLCQRAASDKSWNKSNNATKYVIAAKGKGLTCGVPAPVCPEDIKKCNEEYLCTYGTTGLDANLSWLNNSFADEAKLRDLSCNVKEIKTSVKKPNTAQVVNGNLSGTWDVLYSLCTDQRYEAVLKLSQDTRINKNEYYATYNAPHGYYTGTAQDNNGNFAINLDRGLVANGFINKNYNRAQGKDQNGCLFEAKKRLKKSKVKIEKTKSCVLDVKNCTTKQLCARGTRIVNSNFLWQTNINFEKYVAEAKRRGLSCGTVVTTCIEDAKKCTFKQLCGFATYGHNEKRWIEAKIYQQHVLEAARRGYSCGVKTKPQIKKQECAKNANLCNDIELCYWATRKQTDSVIFWGKLSKLYQFVQEAKRRGLSCGVEKTTQKQKLQKSFTTKGKTNVLYIQKYLNKLGCDAGTEDGLLGQKTINALLRWKRHGGTHPISVLDMNLRTHLKNSKITCGKPKAAKTRKDETIRVIQVHLNRLGCKNGLEDGVMGPKTYSALNWWKSSGGDYQTGIDNSLLRRTLSRSKTKCYTEATRLKTLAQHFAGKWDVRGCKHSSKVSMVGMYNKDSTTFRKLNGQRISGNIKIINGEFIIEVAYQPGLISLNTKKLTAPLIVDPNGSNMRTNHKTQCNLKFLRP
jgi:peptidoglycan hydrolase-like protein with peptidoglycan-binding domain